jgi:hypothetical protein
MILRVIRTLADVLPRGAGGFDARWIASLARLARPIGLTVAIALITAGAASLVVDAASRALSAGIPSGSSFEDINSMSWRGSASFDDGKFKFCLLTKREPDHENFEWQISGYPDWHFELGISRWVNEDISTISAPVREFLKSIWESEATAACRFGSHSCSTKTYLDLRLTIELTVNSSPGPIYRKDYEGTVFLYGGSLLASPWGGWLNRALSSDGRIKYWETTSFKFLDHDPLVPKLAVADQVLIAAPQPFGTTASLPLVHPLFRPPWGGPKSDASEAFSVVRECVRKHAPQ